MARAVTGREVAEEQAAALLAPFRNLAAGRYESRLDAFATFLPPRLVRAAKERCCVTFFGAGISAEAGIPLWWDLLARLGVARDLVNEPELADDPLTAAEVLAHQIGMPSLDEALRGAIKKATRPTFAHFLLAQLYQDVYITTNYDCLFETAWEHLHGVRPKVVTTDADLKDLDLTRPLCKTADDAPIVFKLHGSVHIAEEELILTRGQYRRHYRSNRQMFECIRGLLGSANTFFLGFGHRDPEITRLVEDVIHSFELRDDSDTRRPAFYSLQFNMRERTPEIFAARGIVALHPPLSLEPPEGVDPRTVALSRSLIDLLAGIDSNAHQELDVDDTLAAALASLEDEVADGLGLVQALAERIGEHLDAVDPDALRACGEQLGELAGQGLYVLNAAGRTIESWQPDGLAMPERRTADFRERPYIRQARMYRERFVSTTAVSLFNGNATAFLCVPILRADKAYGGLVFSAFQVGSWTTPLRLQQEVLAAHASKDVSFVLVDGNGVVLLPPNAEFEPQDARVPGETVGRNVGFPFERLRRLSRRDKLVERVWNNIVPLAQDDDVLRLGDVDMYSVVAEVKQTRWKLALSLPTPGDAS